MVFIPDPKIRQFGGERGTLLVSMFNKSTIFHKGREYVCMWGGGAEGAWWGL